MYEYMNESVSQGPPLWVVHEWIMSGSWVFLSLVFSRGHILVSQTGQDWIKIFFSPNSWVRSVRFTAGKALGEIWFMRGRCKKKKFHERPRKKSICFMSGRSPVNPVVRFWGATIYFPRFFAPPKKSNKIKNRKFYKICNLVINHDLLRRINSSLPQWKSPQKTV